MGDVRLIDANVLCRYITSLQMRSTPADGEESPEREARAATYKTLEELLNFINNMRTEEPERPALKWNSLSKGFPEAEDGKYYVSCLVNVVSWCDKNAGYYSNDSRTEYRESVMPALYDPEQFIFLVGTQQNGTDYQINALLDPDDMESYSGSRVTHWTKWPAPVGVKVPAEFIKEEDDGNATD